MTFFYYCSQWKSFEIIRRNLIQQCKNNEGLIDPERLIKQMEDSSNEILKHNADAVRKKLKNFLPSNKHDQKHVLEQNLLINTLKGGMQDAIEKVKSPRNSWINKTSCLLLSLSMETSNFFLDLVLNIFM